MTMTENNITTESVIDIHQGVIDEDDPLERAYKQLLPDRQVLDIPPSDSDLLNFFDVVCLFLNRTIGSGIFFAPALVLHLTRSLGGSLLIWAAGAVISLCTLAVWLELGLTIPIWSKQTPTGEVPINIVRSGGEKNFIEHIFHKPKYLATCSYGFLYITLGTLAGNAIMLARYLLQAANKPPYGVGQNGDGLRVVHFNGGVTGIAVAAITLTVVIHMFSRRGGIIVNNIFAVVKVCFLVAIIIMTFVYTYTVDGVNSNDTPDRNVTEIRANVTISFSTSESFDAPDNQVGPNGASALTAILYVIYAYSGYLQPFYVMAEIRTPQKTVPRATYTGIGITFVLYTFLSVCYWLVLPAAEYIKSPQEPPNLDLPSAFFSALLGPELGRKVLTSVLVISIFGNLLVMTYTAGRVKQEIAKEGVLPFSHFFAQLSVTPFAFIKTQFRSQSIQNRDRPSQDLEQAPLAGLFLHWLTSTITILCVSMLRSDLAYTVLVTLYSYAVRLIVTILVSGGLLYLKWTNNRQYPWKTIQGYKCWLDPLPAIICFATTTAIFFASFVPPSIKTQTALAWFILPVIALTSPLWGVIWWLCLLLIQRLRKEVLVVHRILFFRTGERVLRAEIVDVQWQARVREYDAEFTGL